MSLVKVKEKYQVTLPASVRQKVGLAKLVVDRELTEKRLAQGLEDLKKGRVYGPFASVPEGRAAKATR